MRPPPFDLAWQALKRWLPLDLLEEKVDAARRDLGRVNILVAGKTGVGKTTLINAVFGSRVGVTGVGEPVTKKVAQYEPPGLPLRLWDTRGLETAAFQETLDAVEQAVEGAAASGRPEDRVHIAWVCIAEPGGRVEDADRQLATLCRRHGMPVVAVLTKAFGSQEFEAEVRRLLPGVDAVVPVMAEAYKVPPVEARGLPDLVAETLRLLPAAARQAFVAAQLVDMAAKRRAAKRIAASAAAAAGRGGRLPDPRHCPGGGPRGQRRHDGQHRHGDGGAPGQAGPHRARHLGGGRAGGVHGGPDVPGRDAEARARRRIDRRRRAGRGHRGRRNLRPRRGLRRVPDRIRPEPRPDAGRG